MVASRTALTLTLLVSAVAGGAPAHAGPFDAFPTTEPEQLATLRGGLRAGGLDLEFAANVRTLVNGAVVLESVTNLTPGGTAVQRNLPGGGIDPARLSFVSGQGDGEGPALPVGLAGLAGQRGIVLEDPSGITAAMHSVTREQILGVIFTSASNQQIRQEVTVEVSVLNFGRFQSAAQNALLNSRLLGSLNLTR